MPQVGHGAQEFQGQVGVLVLVPLCPCPERRLGDLDPPDDLLGDDLALLVHGGENSHTTDPALPVDLWERLVSENELYHLIL